MPHPQSLSNNQQKVFCAFTISNYNVYFWSMLIAVFWRVFIHWVTGLRKLGRFPQGSGIHDGTHKHRARYGQRWTRIDLSCLDNPSKTIIWSLLIPGYFQWLLTFLCSSPHGVGLWRCPDRVIALHTGVLFPTIKYTINVSNTEAER